MSGRFYRHGSFYTPINSDCVGFCPHPTQQQYLFTGHYELLSKEQGKLGQLCLSEVQFSEQKVQNDEKDPQNSPKFIPETQFCTATNENQEAYMTRTVDIPSILTAPHPTFGQCVRDNVDSGIVNGDDSTQGFINSNISLKIHDMITIPALLDAEWSHQLVPVYSSQNNHQNVVKYQSLIATALEDGSVRLYSTANANNTNNENNENSENNDEKKQFIPHSALQISTRGICLYVDWFNRQRYSPIKALYADLLPQVVGNKGEFECEDDDGFMFQNGNNYVKFWKHYDEQIFGQIKKSQDKSQDKTENLQLTPHFCLPTPTTPSTPIKTPIGDNIGDYGDADGCDDEFYDFYDFDQADFYLKGKLFTDQFFTCSLSDGSVAIVDVKNAAGDVGDVGDVGGVAQDGKMGLELTHHWKAHHAECWVASCDTYNPNLVYTGADDCLMKMWDLRLINTVNQHMDFLGLNPEKIAEQNQKMKVFSYKNHEKMTCQQCGLKNLSLYQKQTSPLHGGGFDISQCSLLRGINTQCINPDCFCDSSTDSTTPMTSNYKYNISKLSKTKHFHPDFTPVEDAYPLITNNQHGAGVIEIKPHPYNPFVMLTGSYDNHISLYDKRNLRKPITKVDTHGGVWRIKWHQNPIFSNQFLLVNMYNGVQFGNINGMQIDLNAATQGNDGNDNRGFNFGKGAGLFDHNLLKKHEKMYNNTDLFQNLPKIDNKSYYPSTINSAKDSIDTLGQKNDAFFNTFQELELTTPSRGDINTDLVKNAEFNQYLGQIYNFGNDSNQTANLEIKLLDDEHIYTQHGPKSIVYGGDFCMMNNISDKTIPEANNIAVTCSFYNKRTDLLQLKE
jgi:WD40 repeat protein